jgi:hypothetical protein
MTIDGDVIIEDNLDIAISCNTIWIRAGSLKAGSAAFPFTHRLTFTLNGLKNDPGYYFDPVIAGNKMLIVTGTLSLFGVSPATTWTKLSSTSFAGDYIIQVLSANGWNIGDSIVLAPSFGVTG